MKKKNQTIRSRELIGVHPEFANLLRIEKIKSGYTSLTGFTRDLAKKRKEEKGSALSEEKSKKRREDLWDAWF